jgi:Phospholipase_D-nuclease N-terminal
VTPSTHTVAQKVRATIALQKESQMFFDGGYTYSNFLMNVLGIFAFVVWFWLLVIIYGDLFRRHDMSGWGKALWVLALVLTSYLGIFAYLITQGRGMAERNAQQAQQARDELRRVVGYSAADEITKLDQLKKSGSITDDEFRRLRTNLIQ